MQPQLGKYHDPVLDRHLALNTGMILGTPNYMAPEQMKGQTADARSDVFALGTVFYELLAGRKAFDGDSLHTVLDQVLQHEPPALRSTTTVQPDVCDIFTRAHLLREAVRDRAVGKPMFAHVDMNTQGAMLINMIAAAVKGLD
jgi:serine/threonine protein kinase